MRVLPISFLLVALAAPAAEKMRDIEFARPGGAALTLDATLPEGRGPFPAVIVVHGGGWEAGDRNTYVPPLFAPLDGSGMTWFTIDYRLAPQHRWPAQIEDLNAAIRWVKDNARRYKVDPRRVALVGESAGGHMVAYAAAKNRGKEAVAAVVCFYGPTDLEKREIERQGPHKNLRQLLGISDLGEPARKALREASPITWVHRGMPPVLFIHGTADQAVPFEQSPAMCEAMKKVGGKCEVVRVEGAPHGIGAWEKSPEFQAYKGKMIAWLKQALGGSENETGRR